jgi:acetoin utilization deacetylase AcuC-like enzyme
MAKVGHVFHPQYLRHDTGPGHPERPDRLRAIEDRLQASGLKEQIENLSIRPATPEEIALVHDKEYIDLVARTSQAHGVYLDGDTFASPDSYEAALLAAGGLLTAVDNVAEGKLDHAFAMVRPPGHHAERDHAMGFCLFNNVGVAAEYLIQKFGKKRVAVVDYDVHHGNSTQHMFYDRDDLFYVSTHRWPFYPGTGAASERGKGAGAGYTLNLPMGGGCGDEEYKKIFSEKLIPALKEYRPDFLLVSAGFDSHRRDPLGGMRVTEAGFAWMSEELEKVAQEFCGGRSVYTLEGGYDLEGLSKSVEAVLKVLLNE